MGSDFLERAGKTIKRSWDRRRVALATSDLLTRQPGYTGRSVVGELIGAAQLTPGEKLTVEQASGGLVARRGLKDSVRIPHAPSDVMRGIEESCGIGVGTVEEVHEAAGVVEISIC
jgi:hypothetical protein